MSLPTVSVAILAGGHDRRMRGDKAMLPLGDKPLLLHVAERARAVSDDVFLVSPEAYRRKDMGLRSEYDRHDVGPIAGLETALLNLSRDCLLLMACDMPFVDPRLLHLLLEQWSPAHQAVAFRIDGVAHATPALYRRDVLFVVERQLARREYDMRKLLGEAKLKEIGEEKALRLDPDLKSFVNLNTQEAYRRYALEAAGKPPLSAS